MCEGVIEEVTGLIVPEENCECGEEQRCNTVQRGKPY